MLIMVGLLALVPRILADLLHLKGGDLSISSIKIHLVPLAA